MDSSSHPRSTEARAAVRRANQVYYEHFSERTPISCGVAYTCPQFPRLHDGNHLDEIVIPDEGSLERAWEEAEAFFAERGLTCYRWTPAFDQPAEPLEQFLVPRGYQVSRDRVMIWQQDLDLPRRPDVRMVQARAMRDAYRAVIENGDDYDPQTRAMLADVALERLDDPNYDAFVALRDGQPAGGGALMQVGDLASVEDVQVVPAHRRKGVATTMLSFLLAMSRRLSMRLTVVEWSDDNEPARALYERCGFASAGTYVAFVAPAARV